MYARVTVTMLAAAALAANISAGLARADLDNGLIAFWSFDAGTAHDDSGHGHDGMIVGAAPCPGIRGPGALHFDGSADYVRVPHIDDLDLTTAYSTCAWFIAEAIDGRTILSKADGAVTPPPSPRACWSFDEASGTVAHDCSGHGFDAIFWSAPTWVPGVQASGLEFVGEDMARQIPPAWDDSISTGLSLSAWLKWYGGSADCFIFDGRDSSRGACLYVRADGVVTFNLYRPGEEQTVTCPGMCIDRWTHVVVVFDGAAQVLHVYMDGLRQATAPAPYPYERSSDYAAIGNNHWAPGNGQFRPFNGVMDELCVWDVALTFGQVSQLYHDLPVAGDLNCDGLLNVFDIDPFVLGLTDPLGYEQAFPNCDVSRADVNGDCWINAFDIDPFVALLAGG